ncbi:MAG: hypothetical protein PHN72_05935 [Bacilli bacterium]|nr:hypothetical protein [Bacilli bacterium]
MERGSPELEAKIALNNLIKSLTTITNFETYKEAHNAYKDVLKIVMKWLTDFKISQKLSVINHEELLSVYHELDDLKGKWLFNENLGKESELSDEVIIWIWEVMELRKMEIEMSE